MNAWFGPKGTVSPLHHDPHHNLLAQVVGEKYIRIYSTSETEKLYAHDSFLLSNTSQVRNNNYVPVLVSQYFAVTFCFLFFSTPLSTLCQCISVCLFFKYSWRYMEVQ